MQLSEISTTQIGIIILAVLILAAGIAVFSAMRKRRTDKLRTQFGGAEYTRALKDGGSRRQAEALLEGRAQRVESLHIRPLAQGDRARFVF